MQSGDNPEKVNRRGCLVFSAFGLLILAIVGWLAFQRTDSQQANEVLSGSSAQR